MAKTFTSQNDMEDQTISFTEVGERRDLRALRAVQLCPRL